MEPKPPTSKPSLPWPPALDAVLRLLDALQAILPAFLVAWAGKERRDADNALAALALAEGRADGAEAEVKILESTAGLGRRALLDRAIRSARLRAKPSP